MEQDKEQQVFLNYCKGEARFKSQETRLKMHNYNELLVWQKSRELVKDIYLLTKNYSQDEKFGLVSQMRRSAVSIPSNIAEGSGRSTDKDFANFLSIAMGSSFELETQCWLSLDLGFIEKEKATEIIKLIKEIQKMLYSFRLKIKS